MSGGIGRCPICKGDPVLIITRAGSKQYACRHGARRGECARLGALFGPLCKSEKTARARWNEMLQKAYDTMNEVITYE